MRIRRRSWTEQELRECPFYMDTPQDKKGMWKQVFPKDKPLYLELGCGKGSFIAEFGVTHPEVNILGIDLIDTMLGLAKRKVEEVYRANQKPIDNVILTRCDIERLLSIMDEKDKVERIYIHFCNPWPRGKHHKKRLTHPKQLELYKTCLVKKGEIHFKTDDDNLFSDSLHYFEQAGFTIVWKTGDLHHEEGINSIMTEHERMFSEQGILIKALIAKYEA